jgi:hypothetical protein
MHQHPTQSQGQGQGQNDGQGQLNSKQQGQGQQGQLGQRWGKHTGQSGSIPKLSQLGSQPSLNSNSNTSSNNNNSNNSNQQQQQQTAQAQKPKQIPLTCTGHTRPVVDLCFSSFIHTGDFFMISACKDSIPILRKGNTGDWVGSFQGHKVI